jgi:Tocopherol cyclase
MEGYYWRLWDSASGRCIVVLCGVCRGPWAVVALAAHPGGIVRWADAGRAWADPSGLGAAAWEGEAPLLRGSERRIAVDLGPDARVDAALEGRRTWARRGLGIAHVVPGLPQYWQPVVLGARVRGEAVVGGEPLSLDGWEAYVEKNWGGVFPDVWWWGQAGFGDDAMAAFAGGPVAGRLAATAVVARAGDDVIRLVPPVAAVRAEAGGNEWRVRARSARWSVTLEGAGGQPHVLPVPVPTERRSVLRSEHHLAGAMRIVVRRGRRLVLDAESKLAGLEVGTPAGDGH